MLEKWGKRPVCWSVEIDEGLYEWRVSVAFTWQVGAAAILANELHNEDGEDVLIGGPGVKLLHPNLPECPEGVRWVVEDLNEIPGPVFHHNSTATFTTRGCDRGCAFCAVTRLEGKFRELPHFRPAPIVCDNNLLMASRRHIERVVDLLKPFPEVDFNQGLDARLLKGWHLDLLRGIKKVHLRFALDHTREIGMVDQAIRAARAAGFPKRSIGVYVLIGFNDTPEDAQHRLEWVRAQGVRPNPMRYHPLDAPKLRAYISPNWTEDEMRRTMKYYANLRFFEHIPFKDFDYNSRRRAG